MGALTKKEREALEDVFLSIHSKNRSEQFFTLIQKTKKRVFTYIKLSTHKMKNSAYSLYFKSISKRNK